MDGDEANLVRFEYDEIIMVPIIAFCQSGKKLKAYHHLNKPRRFQV